MSRSKIGVVKGSQRMADQQRRIFDEFCQKHGVKRTRGGSWVVYKGTKHGHSPCENHGPDWWRLAKRCSLAHARIPPYRCEMERHGPRASTIKLANGAECGLLSREDCSVGLHFCFTIEAALEWGEEIYELHVPPSASAIVPTRSRQWADSLSHGSTKARASHLRVGRRIPRKQGVLLI